MTESKQQECDSWPHMYFLFKMLAETIYALPVLQETLQRTGRIIGRGAVSSYTIQRGDGNGSPQL